MARAPREHRRPRGAPRSPPRGGVARRRAFATLLRLENGEALRLRDALYLDDLEQRDRALAFELALGSERHRLTIDHVAKAFTSRGYLSVERPVLVALRMGLHQLMFMPRIPVHAAVDATVALLPAARRAIVNGLLRRASGAIEPAAAGADPRRELALPDGPDGPRRLVLPAAASLPDPQESAAEYLGLVHGLPSFLVQRWIDAYGADAAAQIARAAAVPPPLTLRVHSGRCDRQNLAAALEAAGLAVRLCAHPLALQVDRPPFATAAFADGWFSVQDLTALAVIDALAPAAGEVVVDLCAAPGGKATAIGERLSGGGLVVAHDRDPRRLERVAEAVERLRLGGVVRVVADPGALPAAADAVLADVPCSNSGVLARRVEVRRRLSVAGIRALADEQVAILGRAIEMVRPGGRVVYSTCSLEPEENQEVVRRAAGGRDDLAVGREVLTLPEAGMRDGGFFAVIRRLAPG